MLLLPHPVHVQIPFPLKFSKHILAAFIALVLSSDSAFADAVVLASQPAGMDAPIDFLAFGFLLILTIFLLLNLDRRFRDYMSRALVRPYNFFADIRDQRIIPNVQTALLLLAISGSLLLVIGGLLYSFRDDPSSKFFVEHFLPWSWMHTFVLSISGNPLMLCLVGTLVVAGMLLVIALLVRFAAMFVKGRIHLSDAINVVVWSALPAIFLLPFGMIVTRLDRNENLGLTALWVVVVLFAWFYYRLLKGVAVLFDIYPTRVYLYWGTATAILLVATVLHMDYHHDWLRHLDTFNQMRAR